MWKYRVVFVKITQREKMKIIKLNFYVYLFLFNILFNSSLHSQEIKVSIEEISQTSDIIFVGNVTTDGSGYATVSLPNWFEALNKDFRYQLTVIGDFAQAIISQEVQNNQFTIRTDKPNVKISWQVTGIRKDPWAEKNRIQVEEKKKGDQIGKYLHPEVYDMPESMGVDFENNRHAIENRVEK